jgi:hypothetical protein
MRHMHTVSAILVPSLLHRTMVHLHGVAVLSSFHRTRSSSVAQAATRIKAIVEKPPNPATLLTQDELLDKVGTVSRFEWWIKKSEIRQPGSIFPLILCCMDFQSTQLLRWWEGKKNVLCMTGAGLSTESGLADYRGHNGSYHRG